MNNHKIKLGRISLKLLMALDSLLTERSVTRAAKKNFLTQPTISNSLSQLRDIFNDDLLVKGGRSGANLTPLAIRLAPLVKTILEDVEKLATAVEKFDPATSNRTFNIGIAEFAEYMILPKLYEYCLKHAPNIKLLTENATQLHEDRDPTADKLDLYLGPIYTKGSVNIRDKMELIFEDTFVMLARKNHPALDEIKHGVVDHTKLHYLVGSRFYGNPVYFSHIKSKFHKDKQPVNITAIPQLLSVLSILEKSDFVTVATKQFALNWVKRFNLDYRDIQSTGKHQLYQIWPQELDSDPGHIWLRKTIQKHCLPKESSD